MAVGCEHVGAGADTKRLSSATLLWGVSTSEPEWTQRDSAQQHGCGVWACRSRSGPEETQLTNTAVGCEHVGTGADPQKFSSATQLWGMNMLEPEQTQRQKTVCTTQKNFQVLKTEYSNQSFSEDYGITCYTM